MPVLLIKKIFSVKKKGEIEIVKKCNFQMNNKNDNIEDDFVIIEAIN
jgi:hypothetical protein